MSVHYYCGKTGGALDFTASDWYELMARAQRTEELICRHYAIVAGHGMQDRMRLAVDEWGCWHPEGSGPSAGKNLFEQQSTMRDAVVAAVTLNIFNNHCDKVRMANLAQLCNNLHSLFLTAGENCVATPNYYVFELFRPHQGAEAIRTVTEDGTDLAGVSVSASVMDGYLTLTLANCSCEESVTVNPVLLGADWDGETAAYLLCGDGMRAHNTFEAPENVVIRQVFPDDAHRLTLPPASVAMLRARIRRQKRLTRSDPGQLPEYAVEGADALKSAFQGNLCHPAVPVGKQSVGVLEPVLIQQRPEGNPERVPECIGKTARTVAERPGNAFRGNILPEVLLDVVQHPGPGCRNSGHGGTAERRRDIPRRLHTAAPFCTAAPECRRKCRCADREAPPWLRSRRTAGPARGTGIRRSLPAFPQPPAKSCPQCRRKRR